MVVGTSVVVAQQEYQFGNYTHNPYQFNPALAGLTDFTQIDLGYRNQHISSDGNPVTMYLTGTSSFYFKNNKENAKVFNPDSDIMYTPPLNSVGAYKHVVGARFMSDAIGPFQKTELMASYGVHLPMTEYLNLGASIGLGWNNIGINPSKVTVINQSDDVLQNFGARWNQNNIDLQFGLVTYTDRFTFGFSGTQLLANKLKFSDAFYSSKLNSHWMFYSSYKWNANDDFMVEPYAMLRLVKNAPANADIGAKFHYKYIWLGAHYRTSRSFGAAFGLHFLKNFYVSYGFEYGAKSTRIATAGTHEVQLGAYFGKVKKKTSKITTPSAEETNETDE